MPLILPHKPTIQRHARIPYLWRVRCVCRWSAFAATEDRARAAALSHVEAEEAFPDYSFLADDPTEWSEQQ